jgi:gliding motility-associated lipoprotein GldH
MRTTKNSLLALGLLFLVCSCDKARVFDEYKELDGTWSKDSVLTFNVEQKDTVAKFNLFVTTRTNNNYPYNNMFLIVQMQQPGTRLTKVDTLEYQMANPDGSLMGDGFSDIKESKLWYKEKINFPKPGKYTFKVKQAVRQSGKVGGVQQLEGITEVGFRIESTE